MTKHSAKKSHRMNQINNHLYNDHGNFLIEQFQFIVFVISQQDVNSVFLKQMTEKIITGPVRIDSNFKAKSGVFFNKDAKMSNLQFKNQELKDNLKKEMDIFEELSKSFQQNRSKMKALQNQNGVLQVEELMLKQSISKLTKEQEILNPNIVEKEQSIKQIEAQVTALNQELEKRLMQDHEEKNLIKRFKQEIKMEKMMSKSEKNMNNICQSLKKNSQNYEKNVEILKNKLESKKKYFNILLKKVQKIKQAQNEPKTANSGKKQIKHSFSSSRINYMKPAYTVQNFEQVQKKDKGEGKANMKNYNELIRKKNAILAKKK